MVMAGRSGPKLSQFQYRLELTQVRVSGFLEKVKPGFVVGRQVIYIFL